MKGTMMKYLGLRSLPLWLLYAVLATSTARAQWQSIGNLDSYTAEQNGVTLKSGATLVRVLILAPDLVRIRVATEGVFLPDQSWAVVKNDWGHVAVEVRDSIDELQLATGELVVKIRKRPLRFSFVDRDGRLVNKDDEGHGISWSGRSVRVWKSMPQTEQYYGLGEKSGALGRKDKHVTKWTLRTAPSFPGAPGTTF